MAILVTGGAGFVGMNLLEQLLNEGERVVAFDRLGIPTSAGALHRHLGRELTAVIGDINESAHVEALFTAFDIEAVVHAAVITSNLDREAREPKKIIDTNTAGTVNVMSAAHAAGCNRLVYVSSGQAYGKTHGERRILYEDLSPSRPEDIYGITKFAAEQIALRLGELWHLQVTCLRLGSVFGPWEFDTGVRDMLSPHLRVAQLAIVGGKAIIPTTEVWRDWIYSRDVAAGIVAALRADAPRYRLYHLASGMDWRNSFPEWCATLQQAYPDFSWRLADEGEQPNVSYHLQADRSPMDIGRLVNDLGFKPRYAPGAAFRDYAEWIRRHEDFVVRSNDPRNSPA